MIGARLDLELTPHQHHTCEGMTIDWKTDGLNEQFVFNNPKKHTDADVEKALDSEKKLIDKLEDVHPMKQVAYASVIQVTVFFGMFGCMAINQELIKFLMSEVFDVIGPSRSTYRCGIIYGWFYISHHS